MLQALSRTGWTNYSLFLAEDGLLVGYVETPDFEALGDAKADESMAPIEEIFHLPELQDKELIKNRQKVCGLVQLPKELVSTYKETIPEYLANLNLRESGWDT